MTNSPLVKMPHARVVVIDSGGHSMHEESHADRVAELIADFTATHATA